MEMGRIKAAIERIGHIKHYQSLDKTQSAKTCVFELFAAVFIVAGSLVCM
jgi:hypothetical protein